jgi:hypothetical protein
MKRTSITVVVHLDTEHVACVPEVLQREVRGEFSLDAIGLAVIGAANQQVVHVQNELYCQLSTLAHEDAWIRGTRNKSHRLEHSCATQPPLALGRRYCEGACKPYRLEAVSLPAAA